MARDRDRDRDYDDRDDRNEVEIDLEKYMAEGAFRARELDNRGPVRRTSSGSIDPTILDSYWRHGFYIFESIFGEEELNDLASDIAESTNVASEHPDVVEQLISLLKRYIDQGRSTPGRPQTNDVKVQIGAS